MTRKIKIGDKVEIKAKKVYAGMFSYRSDSRQGIVQGTFKTFSGMISYDIYADGEMICALAEDLTVIK